VINNQTLQVGWKVLAAVLLLILPIFVPKIGIHLLIEILAFSLFGISLNLMLRGVGLVSFGHAAFFGVGAYAVALICNHIPGMPLLIILLFAALAGLLAALGIGFFCVRTPPHYFPLLTLAFQMFLLAVALKWRSLTGGDDGMGIVRPDLYLPGLGSISLMNITNLYYLTLILVGLTISGCYFLLRTPLGNTFNCMRENASRTSFLGYDLFLTKLTAFSISGLLAAFAGGLYALFQEFVSTSCMDLHMSFNILMMIIIGGVGKFLGPVLGVAFLILFQNWLSGLTTHWPLFLGVAFIVVVLYLEEGLVGILGKVTKKDR